MEPFDKVDLFDEAEEMLVEPDMDRRVGVDRLEATDEVEVLQEVIETLDVGVGD